LRNYDLGAAGEDNAINMSTNNEMLNLQTKKKKKSKSKNKNNNDDVGEIAVGVNPADFVQDVTSVHNPGKKESKKHKDTDKKKKKRKDKNKAKDDDLDSASMGQSIKSADVAQAE